MGKGGKKELQEEWVRKGAKEEITEANEIIKEGKVRKQWMK